MNNELQIKMADDLNIVKFNNEHDYEYNQRIVYSAASLWVRTLIYGNSINDVGRDNIIAYPDIMYVQSRLSKVVGAYIINLKMNSEWLKNEDREIEEIAMDLSRCVIREMINTNNLAEICQRKIAAVPLRYYKYGDWLQVRGNMNYGTEFTSIGVAQWTQKSSQHEIMEEQRIIDIKGKDYYEVMDKKFIWEKANLASTYLIFKEGSARAYSKCWIPYIQENISEGIHILKEKDDFNGGYVLIKRVGKDIKMAIIDPWYIKTHEIYRILYALNINNDTPAQFQVNNKDDCKIVWFASALPDYESRIIMNISWPFRYYDDKYTRVIPNCMWSIVENLLTNLGIKILYK